MTRRARERVLAFAHTPRGQAVLTWARRGFTLAVLLLIAAQLSRIGWGDVWAAIPTNPLFYLLVVLGYLALPLTESLIYGRLWGVRARSSLSTLLKKRIYNQYVVEYSGEVYLYWWGKRATGRSRGAIARDVRDVNILSAAASVLVGVALVTLLVASGWLDLEPLVSNTTPLYWGIGLFATVLLGTLIVRFRKHLFSLTAGTAALVLALHIGQVLAINGIRLAEWTIGAPEIALSTWLIFLAAAVALERLPFIPSKEYVFIGVSVELAHLMDVGSASVASVLLALAVMGQILNLAVYGVISWHDRRRPADAPDLVVSGGALP